MKKLKLNYTCTDPDCAQYMVKVTDTRYSYIEYREWFGNYIVCHAVVDLQDYTLDEICTYCSSYYASLEQMVADYGFRGALQIMFWCKAQDAIPILRSLKGQKFLIKGNHDRCNDNKFLREFVKVTEYLEVKDSGRTVILCHYPIPCFKNHFYGSFHLYGHVHNSFEWNMMEHDKYLMEELYTTPCQMFNVGAMMPWMDYTPRTLDEIIAANSHNEAVRNK